MRPIAAHPAVQEPLRQLARALLRRSLRFRARPFGLGGEGCLLAIAPHPDDACLGCGGLILQRRLEGLPVAILYLTGGGASHLGHPRVTPDQMIEIRRREALTAAGRLGVDTAGIQFAGLADGRLDKLAGREREEAVGTVRAAIEAIRPAQIILPARRDGSTEHEGAFALVLAAVRSANLGAPLLEFPVWAWWSPARLWGPLFGARRVWRIDLRGYEGVKRTALAAHASQMQPTPPWSEPVLPRGFAEAFCIGEEYLFEMKDRCAAS